MSSEPHSASPLDRRRAGILLHPSSLPGGAGNGDLGPDAYRFVDFLVGAGFSVWQTLPLGPTHGDLSPYAAQSVHAGNEQLVGLEPLVDRGWLDAARPASPDPDRAREERLEMLDAAYRGFLDRAGDADREAFAAFQETHRAWLDDYVLFRTIRKHHQDLPWWQWPEDLRDRVPGALADIRARHGECLDRFRFQQYLFFDQWRSLRAYANAQGVLSFGDLPLFVSQDSADVWAHRASFRLGPDGRPEVVAGVPPDYFSATGQRWGNPHYDWEYLEDTGFGWWVERFRTQLELFDLLRIDHFRGLESFWEIEASADTAVDGRWVRAPGARLLETLRETFDHLPLVAEDLGIITPEVERLRDDFHLPGMKVLQFAFGGEADNPYLPHNYEPNAVVYTGTHDNNTTLGWFRELDPATRDHVCEYFGCAEDAVPAVLARAAFASVALLAVMPMQDVLGLGGDERMNTPGTHADGNWRWRFEWSQLDPGAGGEYRHALGLYGRLLG
mgnify:CR=1 FL=1